MARPGITEEQVFEATEQLQKEGIAITAKAIRERVGTGSYSTINAMLAKWRESKNNIIPTNTPDMPDAVNLAAHKIWTTAWIEALNNIKAEREMLGAAWRERELESCEMLNEIKRLETENEKQKDEISELNNYLIEKADGIREVMRDNNKLTVGNSELVQLVNDAIKRVDDMFEELRRLNINIYDGSKSELNLHPGENGFNYVDKNETSQVFSKLIQLQSDNVEAQKLMYLKHPKKESSEIFPVSEE